MNNTKQGIRRAGMRWRENAPDIFVDAFDSGEQFLDRYTVVVLPVETYENGEKWVTYLNSSKNPQNYGGWEQMKAHDMANFRYRMAYKRIAWNDLPEDIKKVIVEDTSGGK
jgi:hypothetical protein